MALANDTSAIYFKPIQTAKDTSPKVLFAVLHLTFLAEQVRMLVKGNQSKIKQKKKKTHAPNYASRLLETKLASLHIWSMEGHDKPACI